MGKDVSEICRERTLEVFLLLQYDARIWQKLKERKRTRRMNYSKKHLKHLFHKYCFGGYNLKVFGNSGHDRNAICHWYNQLEHSLYRKCERKAKR